MDFKLNKSSSSKSYYTSNLMFKFPKKLLNFIFFLFTISIYSQDFVKKDTIRIDGKTYKYSHISFGATSGTKYFKFMTCSENNFNSIKDAVINCSIKSKLEYSEFYIMIIPNEIIKTKKENEVLFRLIRKIDQYRMSINLSTALIKQKYDVLNNKFEYFINEPITDFNEYKLQIKVQEVCSYLKK
jgi:hypothetical protein